MLPSGGGGTVSSPVSSCGVAAQSWSRGGSQGLARHVSGDHRQQSLSAAIWRRSGGNGEGDRSEVDANRPSLEAGHQGQLVPPPLQPAQLVHHSCSNLRCGSGRDTAAGCRHRGRRGHLALLWDPDGSVDNSSGTGGGVAAEILCLPGVLGSQGILHFFRGDVALGVRARRNFAGLVEKDRGFHPHRCGSAVRDVGCALLPPAAELPAGKNQTKKDDETGALISEHPEGADREALGRHRIEAGALVKPDASRRGRPALLAPPPLNHSDSILSPKRRSTK